MSTEFKEAFITHVDAERTQHVPEYFETVRKEHDKIREVVDAFRTKVDGLISRQRQEYIQAYEQHMLNVQKELYQMREKVKTIENAENKREKTIKLQEEQRKRKEAALKLEQENMHKKNHLTELLQKITSTG